MKPYLGYLAQLEDISEFKKNIHFSNIIEKEFMAKRRLPHAY